MKTTGTKKLLIIFFALLCALGVGLGVMFTRQAPRSVAYAETRSESTTDSAADSEDSDDGTADGALSDVDGAHSEAEETPDEDEDNGKEKDDARFDEETIREVARLLGQHYEIVNLYCHVNNVDARELLAQIKAGEEKSEDVDLDTSKVQTYVGHEQTGEDYVAPDETDEYAEHISELEGEESVTDRLFNEITAFKGEYVRNEVSVSEGDVYEDWYMSPDQAAQYATRYYYMGYNSTQFNNNHGMNFPSTGNSEPTWTIHYPSYNVGNGRGGDDGWNNKYLYYQAYLQLAPGQSYTITRPQKSWNQYTTPITYDDNDHWQYVLNHYWASNGSSTYIIDGDAPSGSVLWLDFFMDHTPTQTVVGCGYTSYFGWYNPTTFASVYDTASDFNNYKQKASHFFCIKILIQRTAPIKPVLVDDSATNPGTVNVSARTKTAYFEGTPCIISIKNDFGAGVIDYTYDSTVSLASRSQHGIEGTGGGIMRFRCSTEGTHIIRIKPATPPKTSIPWPSNNVYNSNAGTMKTVTPKWSDGTTASIEFKLIILTKKTKKPVLVDEGDGAQYTSEGSAALKKKTVNYTGSALQITFKNCDKKLVTCVANGMTVKSWDDAGNLVLTATNRGEYNINLSLTNPAGCAWEEDGSKTAQQFIFHVKEMLIDKPRQVGTSSYSKEVVYDGEFHGFEIAPALEEQLTIIAPGLQIEYDRANSKTTLKKKDTGTVNIIVMPAEGYLWRDGRNNQITFTFTINAVEIDAPRLQSGENVNGERTTKTVIFDPTGSNPPELVIVNAIQDAMNVDCAMETVSWTDKSDANPNVLTLTATNANVYPVTFSLVNPNYKWKDPDSVKKLYLDIQKFQLKAPHIAPEELANNKDKIDNNTKTVYYNTDPDSGALWTANADKYFKLFVGGLVANNQISIVYSLDGLREDWEGATLESPKLTLWGTEADGSAGPAGNYLIYITPTANYQWDTGNNDMYTFKFVINPITRDTLPLQVKQEGGNNWATVGDNIGSADYDGTAKFFRIGNPDNATLFFRENEVDYSLVDSSYNPIEHFGGFSFEVDTSSPPINGETASVLMCQAVDAGTYIVKLHLKSRSQAWRGDAISQDVYYTFTIKAKTLADPVILADECEGYELKVGDNMIEGGYDGNLFQLTLGLAETRNAEGDYIVKVHTNPSGTDFDPETGEPALKMIEDEESTNRIVICGKVVGTHEVWLEVTDKNYGWATPCEYFKFTIKIDFAEVDDVLFHYGTPEKPDEMQLLGSDGSYHVEYFDPEARHYITVTRAGDEFENTLFESQFRIEVGYEKPAYTEKSVVFNKSSAVVEMYDANKYYISVYLTSNYRWKNSQRVDTAIQMVFELSPKYVSLPNIVDDETGALVDNIKHEKSVTYDTKTTQKIVVNVGDNYKAYEIDEGQNTVGLKRDSSIPVSQSKKISYTAKSAGDYMLAITLSDANNYVWDGDATEFYKLEIKPRQIAVPDAFYISADDLPDIHESYEDIKEGRLGEAIVADSAGLYQKKVTYDAKLHYIYLFGYAVVNKEVTISITAKDASNAASGIGDGDVSVASEVRGHYAHAKLANEYVVSVAFKNSLEFNKPNCYWQGVAMGEDTAPREFVLTIEKRGLDLPKIKDDPTQAWVDNSLNKHYTYSATATGFSVEVENCLSSNETTPFMSYHSDESRTARVRDTLTNIMTFSVKGRANVGISYRLRISLDSKNEFWNSGVADDVDDRYIDIIIDKLGIAKPSIVNESEPNATYAADGLSKSFTYNRNPWPNALKIQGIDEASMTRDLSGEGTTGEFNDAKDFLVGTTKSDAGTYSVTVTLKDAVNTKWDGTTDDSTPITFSLIIEPKKIAKPEIVAAESTLDTTATINADNTEATTTYWKDNTQKIAIANFVTGDPDGNMTVNEISSGADKFTFNENDDAKKLIIYGAQVAGEYVLEFAIAGNVCWADGTADAVIIKLIINKKEYDAPEIKGLTTPSDTKTVVYNFAAQQLVIDKYDEAVTGFISATADPVTGETLKNLKGNVGVAVNEYPFEATGAGTYTVTFEKKNFANECWTGVTDSRLTFKFVIQKLELEIPKIDGDFLLTGESATDTRFVTTYNEKRHGALVVNVLGSDYMTYRAKENYNTIITDKFGISPAPIAASFADDGTGTVVDWTVATVFNSGSEPTKYDDATAGITVATDTVHKENYILIEAEEPGKYEVVFTLKNKNNLIWKGNTDADKTLSFEIEKIKLDVPQYKSGAQNSVTYTGAPIPFYVANANNGQATATSGYELSFHYEEVTLECLGTSTYEFKQVSWYGGELIASATQIGKYRATISLNPNKLNYIEWKGTNAVSKPFSFEILPCSIKPTITYGDAVFKTAGPLLNGTPDATTNANLLGGSTKWAKSTTVTATVMLPNIRLIPAEGSTPAKLDVNGIAIEVYYAPSAAPANHLSSSNAVVPPDDICTTLLPATPGTVVSKTDPKWSVELTSANVYNLYYKYEILPDPSYQYKPTESSTTDECTLLKGNYKLYVVQNGTSNSYSIQSVDKAFTIEADAAKFTSYNMEDHIVWEVYLTSALKDPNPKPLKTYTVSDFGTGFKWKNMQKGDAVELEYLDNDSYTFKAYFDANGLQGPDTKNPPATDFKTALLQWDVKWNGVYKGTPSAKYASKLTSTSAPYECSIVLQASTPDAFSFGDTEYKFFFHITPILYDLKGVVWDYSGTPFTFDGTPKTVKLTNLPEGLTVGSYDVPTYDRNVQIYARSQTEHGAKYVTHVRFVSSNRNYVVPVEGDSTTYKDTSTGGSGFEWFVEWEIRKASLLVEWDDKKSEDGVSSVYVPILKTDSEKVEYTYFKDNGDPNHNNWGEVTSFDHVGTVQFKVVATLKSDADPALNFANNYNMMFYKEANPLDNFKIFALGPSTMITVDLKVGNLESDGSTDVASFKQLVHGITPTATQNTFVYNGKKFVTDAAGVPITLGGAPASITVANNLIVTYYSTVNVFRPIPAPTDPGHYLIKLKLTNLPDDGNSYKLAMTEFYFDIIKGTIDPDTYYWRYTHVDSNNKEYVAYLSGGKWLIHHTSDSVYDPVTKTYSDPVGGPAEINSEITEFVYDSKVHTVELFSEDTSKLLVVTKNKDEVNAGKYTSVASFSYNGKLWEAPAIPTTYEWKIEKATISLANVNWTDSGAFVYTVSGGKVKTYSMTVTGLDPLLTGYVTYETTKDDAAKTKVSNLLSDAGSYITTISITNFNEKETNYKLGEDWPDATVPKSISWSIARRELEVPVSNGTWSVFDGGEHDLQTTMGLPLDWNEYFKFTIQYKSFESGAKFAAYDGSNDYGNEYYAGHAGVYKFIFAINSEWNKDNKENVVWKVANSSATGGYDYLKTNRESELTINKATMTIIGWNTDDEASTVNLTGAYASNDFVDYRYYYNNLAAPDITSPGASVGLDQVLAITTDTEFIIEVYVKGKFANDITLDNSLTPDKFAFKLQAPSSVLSDQQFVAKLPYIEGYETEGTTYRFTDEDWKEMFIADTDHFPQITKEAAEAEGFDWSTYLTPENKAKIRVNVVYGGHEIKFLIHDWNEGANYSAHLNIWQGSLSQNAAGDYSVSLLFKKDPVNPRSWFVDADGDGTADTIDRSSVKLDYRISFRMIKSYKSDILSNLPTYTGNEIDILQYVIDKVDGEHGYDNWIKEYGGYFEIIGATATKAGGYTLNLKIRDEYLNTVHWDNGDNNPVGQPGTCVIKWEIKPIYIPEPMYKNGVTLTYDGENHSVYEFFEGYNASGKVEDMSDALKKLIQLTAVVGENGKDAGNYTTTFTLKDENYAWANSTTGAPSGHAPKYEYTWSIKKLQINLGDSVVWNYTEPYQFAIEDGEPKEYEVKLNNVPEIMEGLMKYVTDGVDGNKSSAIGEHLTVIYLFKDSIEKSTNYELVESEAFKKYLNDHKDPEGFGYIALKWSITSRKLAIPGDKTVKFNGVIRDIVADKDLFNFGEGWENYLNVEVMYKPEGATEFISYLDFASEDKLLDYSMFNVLYTGVYKVKFSIKSELNAEKESVIWSDGHTLDHEATLTIDPIEINVSGWTAKKDGTETVSATINSVEFNALSAESKGLFEYVIRDAATGKAVTEQEVKDNGKGIYYTVEFTFKDPDSFAATNGFIFNWGSVVNPYEFINENFGSQPVIWVPLPRLTAPASEVYDGNEKVYTFENYEQYALTPEIKTALLSYGVDVGDATSLIEVLTESKKFVNLADGTMKLNKAGEYDLILRLLPNVNLSWYDPDAYDLVSGKLCTKGTTTPITTAAANKLINRRAQNVDVTVQKASVAQITPEMIKLYESMIPSFEYKPGVEYNLLELDETKSLFELLRRDYGDLIKFEGYKGTEAGEYTLKIMLTDPDSSYWNLAVNETLTVNDPNYPEYDPSYSIKYVKENGKWIVKYVKPDGKGGYIDYNDGDYKLEITYKMRKYIEAYVAAEGLLDAEGRPDTSDGSLYEVDANGVAVKYALVEGNYVARPDGTFIAKIKQKPNGDPIEMPETDSEGRMVVDAANTSVKVTRLKTSTDPYEVKWEITSSTLATPTVNEDIVLYYNGTEQKAEAVLKGFNATYMEIVEGGVGKNAGEYTAKIGIRGGNYVWRDTEDEYVYVTWHIEKTTIDLSEASWRFTDGKKDYPDGNGMVYTRTCGKAVVYWVELINVPLVLRGHILYTTNGVSGAYAGRDAGKYMTTFDIVDPDGNFIIGEIPESLETVEWSIQRRKIEVPSLDKPAMIFDDEPHDLLSFLNLPEDWSEYMTIEVQYASNFIAFVEYKGHNGDPFEAYGAGAYKFVVRIKDGINTDTSNPSVVWSKNSGTQVPEPPAGGEVTPPESGGEVTPPESGGEVTPVAAKSASRKSANAQPAAAEKSVEEIGANVNRLPEPEPQNKAKVAAVQAVCDRIKREVCCTEQQIKEFGKQKRAQ